MITRLDEGVIKEWWWQSAGNPQVTTDDDAFVVSLSSPRPDALGET